MKFYQRFTNIDIDADEARKRFMNRILLILFPRYPQMRESDLQSASMALGRIVIDAYQLERVIFNDFYRFLDLIERLITRLPDEDDFIMGLTATGLSEHIQKELKNAEIDLEIDWKDGKFYPRGARLLDDKLINDPLEWIKNHGIETVYEPFTKALDHFLRARKDRRFLTDSITDAYDALEAMAKKVCNTEKKFDDIREIFISKIKASQKFKQIAKEISIYAHTFRHGASDSKPKPEPTIAEVEAFIYSVGILLRLATQTLDHEKLA